MEISIFEYRYTEIPKFFSVIFWIPKYRNSSQANFSIIPKHRNSIKAISVLYRNIEIQAKLISVLYWNNEIQAKPISVIYQNTVIQSKPISVFPKLATLYARGTQPFFAKCHFLWHSRVKVSTKYFWSFLYRCSVCFIMQNN